MNKYLMPNMFQILSVSAILTVLPMFAISQSCPRSCRCDRRKTVYCNERGLDLIPYGIPMDARSLHLQINSVTNGPITDEVLSGLKCLKKLDLHQNKLTSVPQGLPQSLEYIDLRINRIKYVGKTSLRGMDSLQELHLDENNITNQGLSPLAFQDTLNLEVLVLSNNLLTSFPDDLPVSLRILRLENNLIEVISRKAMERLSNLINLDLSQNAIVQKRIEMGSLGSLMSLRTLDLSNNYLTELPRDLPYNLYKLLLSKNSIKYIYKEENEKHGSLNRLQALRTIDLSSNQLKSVQASSLIFVNLQSVELHDNPWQCDCHLRYLKQWLSSTESTLSSESHIRCSTPSAFAGVTLNSIDDEALICNSRLNARKMMKISEVFPSGFRLQWYGNTETPDPSFIKRSLMYGPSKCNNCTIESFGTDKEFSTLSAAPYMENYSSQDITLAVQANPSNASIFVSRLQPGTHYFVCILDSQQDDRAVSTNQCIDVWTSVDVVTSSPHQENVVFIPLWIIVLCCIVVLVIFLFGVALVVWKKRRALKSKTPQIYSSNRDDVYFPDSYLPGHSRSYRSTLQAQSYGTNLTERTYATCGPANSTQSSVRDSAVDARTEFEVLIKRNETRPKILHTPSSTCSEYQESNTMSTSQTGRSSAIDQSISPPPTYDSLHSYTPVDRRLSLINSSNPPRLGHDAGSFV